MGIYAGNTNSWWNLTGGTDSSRTYIATNKVVQSGLVLNLDAGASTSYVGSGTTWTDLSDKISSATGALPIYNTTDNYGAVKGSGTRTDANASSLVLAVPMNGANNGTTFTDESANIRGSGTAKAITTSGAITSTAQSKFYGSSGRFNGGSVNLATDLSTDFAFLTSNYTIEFWFNKSATGEIPGFETLLDARPTDTTDSPVFGITGSQLISYGFPAGSGQVNYGTTTIANNTWYHLAVVKNGTNHSIYLNGVLEYTTTSASNPTSNPNKITIGRSNSAVAGNYNFNGYIQDLRIYKGVAKYTANFTPPGNPNNGTLTNGPTYSATNGGSIVFDGTNDKVVVPYKSSLNPSNLTLSSWFKRTSAGFYSHPANLPIANDSWGPPYTTYGFEFTASTDEIAFTLSFTDNNLSYTTAPASAALAVGSWVNVVGTYDGSFRKIYVNGQLITSVAETRTIRTTNTDFILGAENRDQNSYMLNGSIAQTLIYSRALSAAEILQNFSAIRGRFGI